ncbi:hypothetical protein KDC22_23620 [Paenibacillus tritici]|uniref:ABC-three component system protein n=1 Tax=Paenibacillus tritici TaxID=1873425 RepID=UPI001BA98B48|nr:ABC-three component system protein [Paenibacillus tritici]QUL53367.1 hypothetical protein KDC22_23620 [Paenibacillus tritici]
MTTNDNTLKTLGFIYQAYIGLIKCLEMNDDEKVIIEHLGDVTLVSKSNDSQQIEVKHHFEETILSDRSHEIWNSVWNWYNNFDNYHDIQEMILFTTAKLSQKSIFRNWESMDIETRYQVFKSIGNVHKQKEADFRKIYNKIFSSQHTADNLKSVLGKFKILSEQQTITTIINQHYKSTFKFLGDKKKMEEFVSSLIGMLLSLPIQQNKWEITSANFNLVFKDYAKRFVDPTEYPLQLTFEDYEPTPTEHQLLSKKCFVSEIHRIDLSDEITDAINDYCRANKTIINYFENNIFKAKELKDYRKQLGKTLSTNKKIIRLDCKDDKKSILPQSQKLYLQSMVMEARTINGISNNRDFFQRGVIHSIVDDGEITWHVGDLK